MVCVCQTTLNLKYVCLLNVQVESSDEDEDDDVNTGRRRKRQKTGNSRPGTHHRYAFSPYSFDVDLYTTAPAREDAVSEPSASEAESEDDIYGGQRGRTFAKKHRQKLKAIASGGDTPNLSAVRFSSRRAAKTANYNEDDDLGISEEDTENMTPNYWAYAEDSGPAIDQVLNHKLKDGVGKLSHSWYARSPITDMLCRHD